MPNELRAGFSFIIYLTPITTAANSRQINHLKLDFCIHDMAAMQSAFMNKTCTLFMWMKVFIIWNEDRKSKRRLEKRSTSLWIASHLIGLHLWFNIQRCWCFTMRHNIRNESYTANYEAPKHVENCWPITAARIFYFVYHAQAISLEVPYNFHTFYER